MLSGRNRGRSLNSASSRTGRGEVNHVICLVFIDFPFSDTDVMEIEEETEPPVTSRQAAEALRILQRYTDANANPTI